MLDSKGFDLWADNYDTDVNVTDENNLYPFAGYKAVLSEMYKIVKEKNAKTILDIGFGTGILTKKLYDDGHKIFGIDFSKKMIETAQEKMPDADFTRFDFSNGLPQKLLNKKFDVIISSYAIHHISDEKKENFFGELLEQLENNGAVIFGDVMFETKADMKTAKAKTLDAWDDEEYYLIVENLKTWFNNLKIKFIKKSYCAGVVVIQK